MRETFIESLGITVYEETLDNGLHVALLPQPGFQQVFVTLTTRFGSTDQAVDVPGRGEAWVLPDGVAHFLEHKMFDMPTGDVFADFARHGAAANAFTSFEQTTYLFSCTEDLAENTRILLDYVQTPYFTDSSVEKEKGIIGQEIRMYDDNPDWRCFFGLLQCLYQRHPLRIPIAGTIESIAQIDADLLYRCYKTFYHPGNMLFFAVGGFDPAALLDVVRENQAAKKFPTFSVLERNPPAEPAEVRQERDVAQLGVSQARCLMGWKDGQTGLAGTQLLRQELLTGVILDTLFGRGSDFYHRLLDEGLIDQQFSWEYEVSNSYGYTLLGGNTTDVDTLIRRVDEAIEAVIRNGMSAEAFERNVRKAKGRFVLGFDSPSGIARNYTAYWVKGVDWLDSLAVLDSLTLEEAQRRLAEHLVPERRAVSVIEPVSMATGV
ncbi:EF-P 5-aminopentanol modification-associated protein YfmH [Alicyclobacillus shizuokensis]|uniref:EF-P 5-aminopentanol modification-associated protein YfmH n=1 Tax=Alicyclobacillus shizuokensis TaxID=392014 RepID=UPI00082A08A9|nr:pitrilysin family protein [Alicyclobacillus shizuokensis]MCL6625950.1 insulinase family protein [Alicyclobacillus shizuokensis]